MKAKIPIAAMCALMLFSLASAHQNDVHKLVQFQMAIMKKGPQWESTRAEQRNQILLKHRENVVFLLESGKAVIAGPFNDHTEVAGIFVLRATTSAEAKAWMDADPAVVGGLLAAEIHPWWSEDIFRKASMPLQLDALYFGFLKKGPNRKEGDDKNPQVQELQKAHIANIKRLAEMKKLVAAGPFGDDGDLRGIFVFRVGSLQEAKDLTATDPMIKSDRLRIELHPWRAPAGVLP
ncbi:MAG: YciI family protein [Pyrinomonadaceae bacterium]